MASGNEGVQNPLRLLGHNRGDHSLLLLRGGRFQLADFEQLGDDLIHDLAAFVDVREFATTEDDRDLHLVFVLEKAQRLLDLEFDIVVAGFRAQPNFFQLGMMGGVSRFLVLLILELAVVHDAADRWPIVGRNFYQVQVRFARFGECGIDGHDAQLSPIGSNHTYGRDSNLLVDASLLVGWRDRRHPFEIKVKNTADQADVVDRPSGRWNMQAYHNHTSRLRQSRFTAKSGGATRY